MGNYNVIFRDKKIDINKLEEFGFTQQNGGYVYEKAIEPQPMRVKITCDGVAFDVKICDGDTGDEYTLHLVDGATGEFVGAVRASYEKILADLAENCCNLTAFKRSQSGAAIAYAESAYGDKPEYLWKDLPDCAVLRRKDSGKWYAVLMKVGGDKFGHDPVCDEIIDLRVCPDELDKMVDGTTYFRGWHMNKKHWLTVVLDGSIDDEKLFSLISGSYELAKK